MRCLCLFRNKLQDKNKVLQKINRLFSKENVDEFRFALKEEVKIVKEEFPEYFEPTEGDYCIFLLLTK